MMGEYLCEKCRSITAQGFYCKMCGTKLNTKHNKSLEYQQALDDVIAMLNKQYAELKQAGFKGKDVKLFKNAINLVKTMKGK